MKRIFWILALCILFGASASFCQIDTMGFSEIGHLILPDSITKLYIADLDNDSLKEIILTTANYIYEYNSSAESLLWQSPQLPLPQSLLFEDINNDGLKDIAEHDSTGIHFFNPHDSTLIWSSPPFEGTYRLYTLGFRNDDSYIDLAIIRGITLSGHDSCITDIYDGPAFDSSSAFHFNMVNAHGENYSVHEGPIATIMADLSGQTGSRRIINIATSFYSYDYGHIPYFMDQSGAFLQFDANSLDSLRFIYRGEPIFFHYEPNEDNGGTIYSVTTIILDVVGYGESDSIYFRKIDSNGIQSSFLLFACGSGWPPIPCYVNSIFGDLVVSRPGFELCYAGNESIYLMAVSNGSNLWHVNEDSVSAIMGIFNSPNIYPQAQVVLRITHPYNYYKLLNVSDGSVSSIILSGNSNITNISDLNHDGNDEILYYQGNRLDIYTLQIITSINDDSPVPRFLSLKSYPNPFNSSTTIKYDLPASSDVTLCIFDILGRKVETLVSGHQAAGHHDIIWDAGTTPSGVYFAKAATMQGNAIIKMIYLK